MSSHLYTQLAWLPQQPNNFASLCRAAVNTPEDEDIGLKIRSLATHGLDENALNQLAKLIETTKTKSLSLTPFRLGIVSNSTSDFLTPSLVATAARYGFLLECIKADFGQTIQEAINPQSSINQAQVDAVLIAIDHRGLPLQTSPGDQSAHDATVSACLQYLDNIRTGFHTNGNAFCIIQTLARPAESLTGSFESALAGTLPSLINDINHGIIKSIANTTDLLLDIATLAETVGLNAWHDPVFWNLAKLPFSSHYLPLYADHVCRTLAAQRAKNRRCLILDLDNTLWGGVIGDDGLEGITIGQGDAVGEAHLEVQQTALALRERGIVLAVSSKNTDAIARQPFREHPDMLLKEEHFAVFQANWNDKATNITAIAKELSLGLDAMVFLDDNPAERALVRKILPQVAVPELPDNPALYSRYLLAAGYFEAIAFSSEDNKRATFYQENAQRVALQQQAGDLDDYLSSLKMKITFDSFNDTGRARIVQLVNKTNQFNLTTKRHSENDVKAIQHSPDCFTLQVRLSDVFGDNGMISVVVCRTLDQDSWHIETWLMSCRVLGRKVENAVFQKIVVEARKRGINQLLGSYHPTERNQLVKDHYETLGFEKLGDEADGTTHWLFDITSYKEKTLPITEVSN
jgi:FkbH-like protein